MLLNRFKDYTPALGLVFVAMGSMSFLSYLYFVNSVTATLPFEFLLAGVSLLSIGSAFLCLGASKEKSFLIVMTIYLLSITLFLRYPIRYKVLTGADNLFEYRASRDIFTLGFWPGGNVLATSYYSSALMERTDYYSSLALAIPAMLAKVSGIPLQTIFEYILYLIGALVPVILFFVIREVFENVKIATVSSVLFAQSSFFFSILYHNIKEQIALIFLLLTLYAFLRNFKARNAKLQIMCFIFMLGIVMSHYTIIYFTIILFLAFFICSFLSNLTWFGFLQGIKVNHHSNRSLNQGVMAKFLFFLVLAFSWLCFIIPWLFTEHATLGKEVIQRLMEHGLAGRTVIETLTTRQDYAGLVVTAWYGITLILTLLGAVYIWFKDWKTDKKLLWVFGGTVLGFLFVLWTFIPALLSYTLYPERVYTISLLFLCSFTARIFLVSEKKILQVALFVFIFTNLFMNLLIPVHADLIIYHPETSIDISKSITQWHNSLQGLQLANWINIYISTNESILCDNPGKLELLVSKNPLVMVNNPVFSRNPYNSEESRYLLLPNYYSNYNYWVAFNSTLQSMTIIKNVTSASNLYLVVNIVYDNGLYQLAVDTDNTG